MTEPYLITEDGVPVHNDEHVFLVDAEHGNYFKCSERVDVDIEFPLKDGRWLFFSTLDKAKEYCKNRYEKEQSKII